MAEFDDENDPLAEFGLNVDGVLTSEPIGRVENEALRNPKIAELVKAWRTEVSCPEVLPYKESLVVYFSKQLKDQDEGLDKRLDDLDDENKEHDDKSKSQAMHDIYSMDMERIKYSLARYLRARILKIENMVHYIESSEEHVNRLSEHEKEFLYSLQRINNNYRSDQIERRVTSGNTSEKRVKTYLTFMGDALINNEEPDLNTFVFAMPETDVDVVTTDNRSTQLSNSSVVVIDYASIKEKVYSEELSLM